MACSSTPSSSHHLPRTPQPGSTAPRASWQLRHHRRAPLAACRSTRCLTLSPVHVSVTLPLFLHISFPFRFSLQLFSPSFFVNYRCVNVSLLVQQLRQHHHGTQLHAEHNPPSLPRPHCWQPTTEHNRAHPAPLAVHSLHLWSCFPLAEPLLCVSVSFSSLSAS